GPARPHLPLVHHGNRRARQLRPRLRLPQRPHRRGPRPQRTDRGEDHPVLLRGGGIVTAASLPRAAAPVRLMNLKRLLRTVLPALSLILILLAIAWLNPRAISYFGFNLMLNLAIPIALA